MGQGHRARIPGRTGSWDMGQGHGAGIGSWDTGHARKAASLAVPGIQRAAAVCRRPSALQCYPVRVQAALRR